MQTAGIDGDQVILLLEDFQFGDISSGFLDMVNSLLSSGEVLNTTFQIYRSHFCLSRFTHQLNLLGSRLVSARRIRVCCNTS